MNLGQDFEFLNSCKNMPQ